MKHESKNAQDNSFSPSGLQYFDYIIYVLIMIHLSKIQNIFVN